MCDELNTGQAQDWSKVVRITKDQVKRLAKGGGGGHERSRRMPEGNSTYHHDEDVVEEVLKRLNQFRRGLHKRADVHSWGGDRPTEAGFF